MTRRFLSIKTKLMVSFVTLTVALTSITNGVTYYNEHRRLMDGIKNEAEGYALGASLLVDGDMHQQVDASKDMESEEYVLIKKELEEFQDITGFNVYTLVDNGDTTRFVIDADKEEPAAIGKEYNRLSGMEKSFQGMVSSDDEILKDEWGSVLSGYAPIKNSSGKVVAILGIDIDASHVYEEQAQIIQSLIMNLGLSGLLILILAFVIARKIAKPIHLLDSKMTELSTSGGDLTQKIEIKTGDELERLGNSVTAFITNIHDIIVKVMHTAEDVNNSSEILTSSITDNTKVIESIGISTGNIAAGSTRQVHNIQSINEKVQEIYGVISKTRNGVNQMEQTVHISGELANTGMDEVTVLNDKTVKNLEAFQNTLLAITRLAEDINGIGEITNTITYISEQINLLALNASIEAARAGEAGKGFEVVAGEIKILAAKASQSASSIESLIKGISSDANTATNGIQMVNETLLEQKKAVDTTGETFSDIHGNVKELVCHIDEISKSFQIISVDAEEIAGQMKDILSIAQDNATNVEELSAGIEEQGTSMYDLEMTAKTLSNLSLNLRENVEKFKIE